MGFSVKAVYGLCHYLTSLINKQRSSQLILRMFEDTESTNPIVHLVSRASMLNIYVEGSVVTNCYNCFFTANQCNSKSVIMFHAET